MKYLRFAAAAALCIAVPTFAVAAEDDSNDTPTSWVWYHGKTTAQVTSLVNQGFRIVDVEVESASPLTLTVAMVKNTGSYAKTWWWYTGVSTNTLSSLLSQNQGRLVDLEPYDAGGGALRYVAVMIKNTGADAKSWWWTVSTSLNDVSNAVNTNQARIVDLEQASVGSFTWYSAIMIKNTGADAKSWWWWLGVDTTFLTNEINSKGARIVDLERRSDGLYNAVLVKNNEGFYWWWLVSSSESSINAFAAQTGSRIIDIEKGQTIFGVPLFYAVFINNSNDLTTRIGEILRNGSDGVSGLYLKEVNGGVRAALQTDFVFEPASTIKTLMHVHAMKRVSTGSPTLSTPLTVFTGSNGSCPQYTGPISEPLETVLKLMMENSDNNRTMAVRDFFGQTNINLTATSLGMSDTQIIHTLGCGGPPPNEMTLYDGGLLHEAVANGYLGSFRQKFYDLMLQSVNNYGGTQLSAIINQEVAALNVPADVATAFRANMEMAYKGGSYGYGNPLDYYRSVLAWVKIPFKSGPQILPKEYVTGVFIHDASNDTAAANTINKASAELLRDEIRAALGTWMNSCTSTASDVAYGAGKPGTSGLPKLAGGLPPVLGKTASVVLSNALPGAFPILFLGANSAQIPFDGGFLLVSSPLVVSLPVPVNASGSLTVSGPIPNQPSLCGAKVYHQMLFADPGAAGFYHVALTNGLVRTFGG